MCDVRSDVNDKIVDLVGGKEDGEREMQEARYLAATTALSKTKREVANVGTNRQGSMEYMFPSVGKKVGTTLYDLASSLA